MQDINLVISEHTTHSNWNYVYTGQSLISLIAYQQAHTQSTPFMSWTMGTLSVFGLWMQHLISFTECKAQTKRESSEIWEQHYFRRKNEKDSGCSKLDLCSMQSWISKTRISRKRPWVKRLNVKRRSHFWKLCKSDRQDPLKNWYLTYVWW